MQYVIFDPEKAVGCACEIQQAYKLYLPADDHEKLLNERGLSYASDDQANGFPSHEHFCFDLSSKSVKARTQMPCVAPASIKAGASAVITGIPTGSRVQIVAANSLIYSIDKLDGDELEFNTEQVPVTYTVIISQFPWADCTINIEAA